jgi:NTP pyrophosphatase (non-canonical NTP hydrolase)
VNFKEYQELSSRTAPKGTLGNVLTEYSLGLTGEAGEVVDKIKKFVYHDHLLDDEGIIEELGDLLWYLTRIAAALEYDLESVAYGNVRKLKKRYPEGFSATASIERVDKND